MELKKQLESQGISGEQYLSQLMESGRFSKSQVKNAMDMANMILGKKK